MRDAQGVRRSFFFFNVTTEPVSLLCFLLGGSHVPWHQFLDERVAGEKCSERQEHKSSPAMESRLRDLNQWPVDRDLCALTCLWKVACLRQRAVRQTMEHHACILRSLLTKLGKQEAEGEDSPHSTAGEFAVSPVQCLAPRIEFFFLFIFLKP